MSIKVVHVLYSGLGGHGSVFFSLVRADKERKVDTKAAFVGIEDLNPDYATLCEKFEVPFTAIRKRPGLDFGVYKKLYGAFRQFKPDVIVLHGSAFIFVAALYRFFSKKTSIIVRETQAHHLKAGREWFWLKWSVKLANRMIYLTRESLQGVIEKFPGLPVEKKAVIIPNGIDTDVYAPKTIQPGKAQIVIGMQSRLQKIKDIPTLLRAFHMLTRKLPNAPLKLRIAGDGPTMQELKALTGELGLNEQVEFCGMLPEGELRQFMGSLDIYVHSTFGETMSNSIMQAMACGLPIVASDVWGVNNMLKHDVNAILVAPENPGQMADVLERLVQDKALASSLGSAARDTALNEYSNYRLFAQYQQVYEAVKK